eukprot:scpid51589/ scgid11320/ Guanine nucleotide-binding protein subunit beta-5; Gbeta5; Transducin beta chain 5
MEIEPSPEQRLGELHQKVQTARAERNKSFDIKGLEKPDALQLRMKSRRCLHVCDSKLLHLDWNVDRRRLAICTEKGEVHCWNALTTEKVIIPDFHLTREWALCCAFSANGQDIVAGGRDNKCTLFSLTSPIQQVVARHNDFVSSCIFACSQQELLTGSGDTTCALWDVETSDLIRSFQGHSAEVMSLAMVPSLSSTVFLSSGYDGTVRVWDTRTAKLSQHFKDLNSAVNCISLTSSGETFAVACQDCTVRLFDLRADAELARFDDKSMLFPCNSLSFSFSSRLLFGASNDYTVNVFDTLRFERSTQLFGHDNRVSCIRTCPDGSSVATASYDGNIRIWA